MDFILCDFQFKITKTSFLGYNNDFKPSFNGGGGRGGYNKRNDFRNGSGDSQSSGGFYRANERSDDYGSSRGGYRSVSAVSRSENLKLINRAFRTAEEAHVAEVVVVAIAHQ